MSAATSTTPMQRKHSCSASSASRRLGAETLATYYAQGPFSARTAPHAIHSIADMKRLLLFAVISASACFAADLAMTPPMGWNSWNKFAGKIDDKTVREIADAMVTSGMRDAGYVYVNIDDTWEGERDGQGFIHSNEKFLDMKALADYVHGKGLKIGIYSTPGPKTCAKFEGSYGH